MTTQASWPKSRSQSVFPFGEPILREGAVATAVTIPALLVIEAAGVLTALGAGVGETWQGDVVAPNYHTGQGYTGVYATDNAATNQTPVGASQKYGTVDVKGEFMGWLKIGDTVAEGALLYSAAGGTLTDVAAGQAVGFAKEAVTGTAVLEPIKVRRITANA